MTLPGKYFGYNWCFSSQTKFVEGACAFMYTICDRILCALMYKQIIKYVSQLYFYTTSGEYSAYIAFHCMDLDLSSDHSLPF